MSIPKIQIQEWLVDIARDAIRDLRVSRYDDAKKGMGKASKWSQEKMEGVETASAKVAEKTKAPPVKMVAGPFTISSGSSAGSVGDQDSEFGGIAILDQVGMEGAGLS
ncbi:hypothetical protein FRC02_008079 [Tulasnella sp. 418]|nr:hypothetical protein FRC02_008079 [Tulasnella sp. 418]